MKTRTTLSIVSAGLVLASLSACNTEKAPYAAKKDTIATTTTPKDQRAGWGLGEQTDNGRREYPQVTVEYGLRNYISIGEPAVEKGEVLKVTVPTRLLANRDDQSRIQYRFMFFKENGTPLRDQPDWRYQLLDAKQQVFLSATSTDTAADWRLEIRSNR